MATTSAAGAAAAAAAAAAESGRRMGVIEAPPQLGSHAPLAGTDRPAVRSRPPTTLIRRARRFLFDPRTSSDDRVRGDRSPIVCRARSADLAEANENAVNQSDRSP